MKSQTKKRVLCGAAIGAGLAIAFIALGAASPEPGDHPLGASGTVIELLLLPLCLPGFLLHDNVISPVLWWAVPYERFGRLAEWLQYYVTYPALQGALYGTLVWLCLTARERFRDRQQR